jgi:predicted heme/steroid binding protein
MKVFSPEELARGSGKEGARILVAVNGMVYDVSPSKRWAGGRHMNRHLAGEDLSLAIKGAPHGPEVLDGFETAGVFQGTSQARQHGLRGKVDEFLARNPFFHRHPHPAVAHGPIGIVTAVPLFGILGLVFQSPCTEWAAVCCLSFAFVTIPAAVATGYFTWWVNYDLADKPALRLKRRLAWAAFVIAGSALAFRVFAVTEPLSYAAPATLVHLAAILALTGVIGAIGYIGGKLTFPY